MSPREKRSARDVALDALMQVDKANAWSFTVGEVTVRQIGGQSAAVMAETLRQTAERLMRPYAASGEFCFRGVRG